MISATALETRLKYRQRETTLQTIYDDLERYAPERDHGLLMLVGPLGGDPSNAFSIMDVDHYVANLPQLGSKEFRIHPQLTLNLVDSQIKHLKWDPYYVKFMIPRGEMGVVTVYLDKE